MAHSVIFLHPQCLNIMYCLYGRKQQYPYIDFRFGYLLNVIWLVEMDMIHRRCNSKYIGNALILCRESAYKHYEFP